MEKGHKFTKETQMANKHMKRYSTLLIKTYKHDM